MDAIPVDLRVAALGARDRLASFSEGTARSGIQSGAGTQTAMAGAAEAAIFADALLGAIRARFEEIRTVTK
ncbi:MAG: hypothetical protein JO060_09335 [Candidatus Eremiobacteraeota bacterium]|nr:hypothetical protein [Candidatus Eremiobacteraeota bacterium]